MARYLPVPTCLTELESVDTLDLAGSVALK
jgi:hypothetical protein